ncbi:MAG: hypothetical protein ABL308_04380 [Oceanicaulis sp.]
MALTNWKWLPEAVWGQLARNASATGQLEAIETMAALVSDLDAEAILMDLDHASAADPYLRIQGNAEAFGEAVAGSGARCFLLIDRGREVGWWETLLAELQKRGVTAERCRSNTAAFDRLETLRSRSA